MTTTVQNLCDQIGIAPIFACLQAIDRHNIEHVWLVLEDDTRVYYTDIYQLVGMCPSTTLKAIGVGGIAWDGSSWEWGQEGSLAELGELRAAFHEALADYTAEAETEAQDDGS